MLGYRCEPAAAPGICVEILIRAPLERVWTLTQDPGVHQRWDLRFSRIEFLPKEDETDPRRFIYETRIVQVSPYAAPVRASPRAWQRMVGKPIFIKARLA